MAFSCILDFTAFWRRHLPHLTADDSATTCNGHRKYATIKIDFTMQNMPCLQHCLSNYWNTHPFSAVWCMHWMKKERKYHHKYLSDWHLRNVYFRYRSKIQSIFAEHLERVRNKNSTYYMVYANWFAADNPFYFKKKFTRNIGIIRKIICQVYHYRWPHTDDLQSSTLAFFQLIIIIQIHMSITNTLNWFAFALKRSNYWTINLEKMIQKIHKCRFNVVIYLKHVYISKKEIEQILAWPIYSHSLLHNIHYT